MPLLPASPAASYPPAVGITAKARDCLACHVDNDPWKAGDKLIIDMLDKTTGPSLRQRDGSKAAEGRIASYFVRTVRLRIIPN